MVFNKNSKSRYIFQCFILKSLFQGSIKSVLDFKLIKEMIVECFKKRPNHGRAQILLLTVANSLSIFILYGLMSLEYLYTRHKLNWAIKQYTIYSAVNTTISFFGSFFGVVIVQKIFKVTDLAFSTIAFLSTTADYLVKAFATVSWQMYMGKLLYYIYFI